MITHDAVMSRLSELRTTAEAADNPHWLKMITDARMVGWATASMHGGVWNPRATLRWIEWAEDVAKRHKPVPGGCDWCVGDPGDHDPWPCDDIKGLAVALGLFAPTTSAEQEHG